MGPQWRYRVTLINKGNIYAQSCLVDIYGLELRDPEGNPYTLNSKGLRDALDSREIVLHHCLSPGYRYFTQDPEDHNEFCDDRELGSRFKYVHYFVYYDPDFDITSGQRLHKYVTWQQR